MDKFHSRNVYLNKALKNVSDGIHILQEGSQDISGQLSQSTR